MTEEELKLCLAQLAEHEEAPLEEQQHIEDFVELIGADMVIAEAAFQVPGVVWKDVRNTLRRKGAFKKRILSSIRNIVVHHSATVTGSAEAYARYHVDTLGWPGMGYHIVIEQDGTVKFCNDLESISYQAGNANSYSVGVSMTGDFTKNKPTDTQWTALYKVIEYLRSYLPNAKAVTSVIAHQECPGYASKKCPALDIDSLRGQLQAKTYKPVAHNFNNDQAIKVTGGGIVATTPTISAPVASSTTYTVKAGDTLSGIAAKVGVPYKKIMELSGITSTVIRAGQKLIIGTSAAAPTTTTANSIGKVTVLVADLWYYNKPDWNAKAGQAKKNDTFTVVQELTVAGAKMYKLKSGNYITANTSYVRFSK